MAACSPVPTPISIRQHITKDLGITIANASGYRSLVGALQYIILTKPEIAFSVNKLSQLMNCPKTTHYEACKMLLRYLKGAIHFGLHFYCCGSMQINCFSDSDWRVIKMIEGQW